MSYSSTYSLNYSPHTVNYNNPPIIPLLNPSNKSGTDTINTTTLTSGVQTSVGTQNVSTGIYAIRFEGYLTTTAADVIVSNAYAYISPPGVVVSVQTTIIPCPVGGFEMVQNQQYWFSMSETFMIISSLLPMNFSVDVEYASATAGTVSFAGAASYVRLS
jgi:hypothetical protein